GDALLRAAIRRRPAATRARRPRVLVVRCDHIGDVTLATAVLSPLRRHLDASQLDVLTSSWAAPALRSHPAIDNVLTVDTPWWLATRGESRARQLRGWIDLIRTARLLKQRRYDIAIDLRGDVREIYWFLWRPRVSERISSDRTGGSAFLTTTVAH